MVRRRFVGLNGLKGIALIAIVLYHCDQGTLRGGFLGVDIFFTISGFLIFSSLLNHIDSGKGIGFKEYYLKRLRRIYPALILMIPVTVSLAWFINQDMLVDINSQIVTAMLGCYNWYAIGSGASYFSQMNPDMFRHLWFMSVLMQFYLLAPLLIYLLRKNSGTLGAGGGTCRTCRVQCAFHGIAVSPGNRSNQSVFRFGHTCHGTLARCHAGMAADDHTAWQRSSGRNGDHGTRSSGLEQDRPCGGFCGITDSVMDDAAR